MINGVPKRPLQWKTPFSALGFTLVELLTVVVVIAILAGLMLPALAGAKQRSRTSVCLSNLKQFGLAFQMYADDHDDTALPNRDGPDLQLGETWVRGWLGVPGPSCTNILFLEESLISPYIKNIAVWRCPAARQDPVVGGVKLPRVRTIALNMFIGAPTNSPRLTYKRVSEISRQGTSEVLTFIDEKISTVNDGCFAMQWEFKARAPEDWILRDKPSIMHRDGANLCFADGHVATRRWQDERTREGPRDDSLMPHNQDILWLQKHGTLVPDE